MKGSRLSISFVIILVLGIIIAYLTYNFLSSTKGVIYILKDNYQAGTRITESMLIPLETDADIVRLGAQTGFVYVTDENIDQVLGTYLVTDVVKGMPLFLSFSDKFGGSPPEVHLSSDYVAVTVPCDNITGVNPYIQYGARVNVYAGFQLEGGETVEYLLLQNVKVLDVQYAEVQSNNSPVLSGVTLELTPEQSIAVQYACEFGKIRLGLVKPGQYKEISPLPYSIDSITTGSALTAERKQNSDTSAGNNK